MNPEWNTPPGGDFVRYIEQLSARAALQAQRAQGVAALSELQSDSESDSESDAWADGWGTAAPAEAADASPPPARAHPLRPGVKPPGGAQGLQGALEQLARSLADASRQGNKKP